MQTNGTIPAKPASNSRFQRLRLLLGDQLNERHSWFQTPAPDTLFVMMEVITEQTYVLHHRQKQVLFFQAMRAFACRLHELGHAIHYLTLTDEENQQDFVANLQLLCAKYKIQEVSYQLPDEYRLVQMLASLTDTLRIPVSAVESEHFLTERDTLAQQFGTRKHWLMETFYRQMRVKYDLLMGSDGKPQGGKWNFDSENRKGPPKEIVSPSLPQFENDFTAVRDTLDAAHAPSFGRDTDPIMPVTRVQALRVLEHFATEALPHFGTYQDAMSQTQPLLYHSLLSFALNIKLIHPLEVVNRCIAEYEARPEDIRLAQIEGFVRQIIGWREYMRGIYWAKMPEYAKSNHLQHLNPLPEWYWTGETHMNCLRQAISNSLDSAYAHHIQRLMVTGNFANLAAIHPAEVNAWYLGIYADAIEWVQLPNTHGMSLFADGGLIATKPYVASGAYINRMSDYCKGCRYDVKKRHGENACPLNSLYWHFMVRHEDRFANNPRIGQAYFTWQKMNPDERAATLEQAEKYLERVNTL
jgi:deoxyribodipyrimidine photolyase-related protein